MKTKIVIKIASDCLQVAVEKLNEQKVSTNGSQVEHKITQTNITIRDITTVADNVIKHAALLISTIEADEQQKGEQKIAEMMTEVVAALEEKIIDDETQTSQSKQKNTSTIAETKDSAAAGTSKQGEQVMKAIDEDLNSAVAINFLVCLARRLNAIKTLSRNDLPGIFIGCMLLSMKMELDCTKVTYANWFEVPDWKYFTDLAAKQNMLKDIENEITNFKAQVKGDTEDTETHINKLLAEQKEAEEHFYPAFKEAKRKLRVWCEAHERALGNNFFVRLDDKQNDFAAMLDKVYKNSRKWLKVKEVLDAEPDLIPVPDKIPPQHPDKKTGTTDAKNENKVHKDIFKDFHKLTVYKGKILLALRQEIIDDLKEKLRRVTLNKINDKIRKNNLGNLLPENLDLKGVEFFLVTHKSSEYAKKMKELIGRFSYYIDQELGLFRLKEKIKLLKFDAGYTVATYCEKMKLDINELEQQKLVLHIKYFIKNKNIYSINCEDTEHWFAVIQKYQKRFDALHGLTGRMFSLPTPKPTELADLKEEAKALLATEHEIEAKSMEIKLVTMRPGIG